MTTQPARTTVSARHVLLSEISAVTSTMRKNSRWATSNTAFSDRDSALAESFGLRVSGPSSSVHGLRRVSRERELMAGFNALKRTVNDVNGVFPAYMFVRIRC
jgi:brefeldin A-resistance guanine nucleotide exchange factor 1